MPIVAEATVTTMETFLQTITTFLTTSLGWASDVLDQIIASPPLTVVCLGMPIVGFGVGLLGRLFRSN